MWSSKTTWLKGQLNVSIGAHEGKLQPIKFGGYRDSCSGHIMAFLCYVTLQDHVIKS